MANTPHVWYCPDKQNLDDSHDRAVALLQETRNIEQRQSTWHELNLWNATLYTNRELVGFRWGEIQAERELWPTNLRTENLIEEIGDAMLSKASSSPLRPSLVPHGTSWETEKAVREADNFQFAVYRQTKSEEAAIMSFLDAYLSGIGCVRDRWEGDELKTEAVFFDNIIIDNRECANRQLPRTYRVRQVLPRTSVEFRYGKPLPDGEVNQRYVDYRMVGEGWVVLVEAWRLPDASGKGGWHSVACAGVMLEDEEWTETWVPLEIFHWQDRVSGFFNKSGVEQLVPFQVRQDTLNDAIELSQDLVCRPRLLVNANSMIDVNQWDNEAGRFLMYSGQKPESFEWDTNLRELYQERQYNKAAAYSHVGLSEMFANADLPQQVRLDSSAGVREFRNMEDARHLRLWTRFEAHRLAIARMHMRMLATNPAAKQFKAVHHPGNGAKSRTITYSAVKALKDNDFSWSMEPASLSSMSPAARRELIRDWSSRGLIDDEEQRRFEGNPDLEREEDLELASHEDILRHIGILESGEYEAPTELTNCPYGVKKITSNYHRLRAFEDVDEEILENHIKWIVTGASIMSQATQPNPSTPFAPTQGMPGTNSATAPAASSATVA